MTTPQEIALADACKGLNMFRKVNVEILGIIENMGSHICSACGHEDPVFGTGGGERLAGDEDVAFLGSIPLQSSICEQTDTGTPTVIAEPDGVIADKYRQAAKNAIEILERKTDSGEGGAPSISIASD